jgi:hypothetical protein
MHELCDLSSAKQARIASKEEAKKPLGNTIQNTQQSLNKCKNKSKMSWSIKQTEILREA